MIIAIDIRNIGKQRTGDEVVFLNLIRNLAEIDFQNTYHLLIDTRSEENIAQVKKLLSIEKRANFKLIPIGSGNKFIWNFWTLPKYLRTHNVDICHIQYIIPFFVPKKTKIVTHIHDISFKAHPEFITRQDLFFLNLLIPRSLEKSSAVVAVSEFTKKELVARYHVNSEKIHVIPNALGSNFVITKEYPTEKLTSVRSKYHLPEKYILYVGTLQPRKNIPYLLQAFGQLRQDLPEYKLVLVGNRNAHHFDMDIDSTLKKHALENSVVFPGYIDSEDLPCVYALAKIFVFPSKYEGFGVPLLEAMSQNLPILASDIPIHKEVAGNAAIFFPLDDIDKLKEMLYSILTNLERQSNLKEAGKERLKHYSWVISSKKLLKVYESLHNDVRRS